MGFGDLSSAAANLRNLGGLINATATPATPSTPAPEPKVDEALKSDLYDYLLNNRAAGRSGYLLPNGETLDLPQISLGNGGSMSEETRQRLAEVTTWLNANPGKKFTDYPGSNEVLDAAYAEFGNGMNREDFDATYQAAQKELGDYWSELPRDGLANSGDGLGGTPTQLAPIGYQDGKLVYSLFSDSVFTGSADRVSYVYQGWEDPDWIKEQAAAGKIGLTTYQDANGNDVQGILIDPSIVDDDRFGVKKVKSYRGSNDSDTGFWGSIGIDPGVGQFLSIGAAVITAGASLGAGALAAEGATIGTALGFEGATASAVTGAATGAITSGAMGGDPLTGALVGGALGAVTGFGDVLTSEIANPIGEFLGTNAVVDGVTVVTNQLGQTVINNAVTGAATGAVKGAISGEGWGDILTGFVAGGAAAAVGTYVGGTVNEWVDGTPYENTLTGGAAGAAGAGTYAAVTGSDISDAAIIGGTAGLIGGGLMDLGASSGVVKAAKDITTTIAKDAVADDPATPATPTAAPAPTSPATTKNQGSINFGFGDSLNLTYQPVARKDMNWGTRLSGMRG